MPSYRGRCKQSVRQAGGGGTEIMKDDKTVRPGAMQTDLPTKKPRGRLGRDAQAKLGQQLRVMFDEVVSEGVPDRFNDLLRRLDEPNDGETA